VFDNNPQGNRLKGQLKTDDGNVYKQILGKAKQNRKEWSNNRAD
jgi:hypothetical protein